MALPLLAVFITVIALLLLVPLEKGKTGHFRHSLKKKTATNE
jgi:hypothetical protein